MDLENIRLHYNERRYLRQQQQHSELHDEHERITMLRRVMNWSKACLFEEICRYLQSFPLRLGLSPPPSSEEYASIIQTHVELLKPKSKRNEDILPNFLTSQRGTMIDLRNNIRINVVDIACGGGGDLSKFTSKIFRYEALIPF